VGVLDNMIILSVHSLLTFTTTPSLTQHNFLHSPNFITPVLLKRYSKEIFKAFLHFLKLFACFNPCRIICNVAVNEPDQNDLKIESGFVRLEKSHSDRIRLGRIRNTTKIYHNFGEYLSVLFANKYYMKTNVMMLVSR
jgi:hypothetical protein